MNPLKRHGKLLIAGALGLIAAACVINGRAWLHLSIPSPGSSSLKELESVADPEPDTSVAPPDTADLERQWVEQQKRDAVLMFKGMDLSGKMHRPGQNDDCRAIVFVFLSTECPIANAKLPALNRLASEFGPRGIEFYGIINSRFVTRAEAARHASEFRIEFPVLFDTSGDLHRRLFPHCTPHAFLVTDSGDVLYQGAIDDQYPSVGRRRPSPREQFLRAAIESFLDSRPIETRKTKAVGCRIPKLIAREPFNLSFAKHIAPIIYGNCTSCHRKDAIAPFPLTSYEEVRKHAAQIRVMVDLKLMPPWKPEHGFGQFRDELALSAEEVRQIKQWIDGSMPFGDEADLPPPPEFRNGWQLGEPDLVLTVREPFHVPADGPDIYQYFVVPSGLTSDRMIAAVEYRSPSPQLVHHASFRWDDTGQARQLDQQFPGPGYERFGGWGFSGGGTLGGWAVGVLPQRMPAGFGRPMRAGSDFVIQTHYHPSGKAQWDQASVGLYFAPPSAKRRIGELFVANLDLRLPPEQRRIEHHAEYTLPVDTTLHAVLPHMHLLGREATAVAVLPDGRVEPLIRIPDWDFNWQAHYFYRRPIRLPAGTRIEFDVVYDNSSRNPINPHSPPRWVFWGEESSAEMAVCYFDVSTDQEADLDRLLKHNRDSIARQEQRLREAFRHETRE